jgi:hypothetical protein
MRSLMRTLLGKTAARVVSGVGLVTARDVLSVLVPRVGKELFVKAEMMDCAAREMLSKDDADPVPANDGSRVGEGMLGVFG